jgi:hypothetical protein
MRLARVDSRITVLEAAHASLLVACAAFLFVSGCKRPARDPVVVRVFRDYSLESSAQLDKKLNSCNGRLVRSGKPILVATYESGYEGGLSRLGDIKPQIIVLDYPQDLEKLELDAAHPPQVGNACSPPRNCPTFIPTWVTGEELEASRIVLAAISR